MYVVSWNLQIRIYVGYLKLSSKNTYSDYSWWQHRLCKIICIACYRLNLELLDGLRSVADRISATLLILENHS
jgi:hypothetical protein